MPASQVDRTFRAAEAFDVPSDAVELVLQALDRLVEGLPRHELCLVAEEAATGEEALEKAIELLEEALAAETKFGLSSSVKNKPQDVDDNDARSAVDVMMDNELTSPDRFYTVSVMLGRWRPPRTMAAG